MFLRFVTETIDANTGVKRGIFPAAYALHKEGGVAEPDQSALASLLDWFEENLPIPNRFNRTKSKGFDRKATKGISWIRESASEHIAKLWEITRLLERNGCHISMIRTDRPGYIVYEDDIQVVAEPFSDTRPQL